MEIYPSITLLLAFTVKMLVAQEPPSLDGQNFRFTVVGEEGFIDIKEKEGDDGNNELDISGYCIDMLESIAERANFTFELLTPSGFGEMCIHPDNNSTGEEEEVIPYSASYHDQYICGQGDVQDPKNATYGTDFYLSLFYITPERRLKNKFTTSFVPPFGGLQLFGTATGIKNIDDLIQQQKEGKQGPACVRRNTADAAFVKETFPELDIIEEVLATADDLHDILENGPCDIVMDSMPSLHRRLELLVEDERCTANGKPIGQIAPPLDYGLTQFGIGVRSDMPQEVIDTIDYWMNELMTCSPTEPECSSLAVMYRGFVATGYECGYTPYPPTGLTNVETACIVLGVVCFVAIVAAVVFYFFTKQSQKKRVRKRFVQQVARNIPITSSPEDIPAEKLSQLFQHISEEKDIATKDDFMMWMTDINLRFLSDADYTYLWASIDKKRAGYVTPIDFVLFLKDCSQEFAMVRKELDDMPKSEYIKFVCRDLDRLKEDGAESVRRAEFKLKHGSRSS